MKRFSLITIFVLTCVATVGFSAALAGTGEKPRGARPAVSDVTYTPPQETLPGEKERRIAEEAVKAAKAAYDLGQNQPAYAKFRAAHQRAEQAAAQAQMIAKREAGGPRAAVAADNAKRAQAAVNRIFQMAY